MLPYNEVSHFYILYYLPIAKDYHIQSVGYDNLLQLADNKEYKSAKPHCKEASALAFKGHIEGGKKLNLQVESDKKNTWIYKSFAIGRK
jgi:hypothetical protein